VRPKGAAAHREGHGRGSHGERRRGPRGGMQGGEVEVTKLAVLPIQGSWQTGRLPWARPSSTLKAWRNGNSNWGTTGPNWK
jgi:hypothetical protein